MAPSVSDKSSVVRWDTPFANMLFPAVQPIFSASKNALMVIVMPQGLGNYPGYSVVFQDAPLVKVYEELNAPTDPQWVAAYGHTLKASASYKWVNSPLVKLNSHLGIRAVFENAKLEHYIISGGNYIVEVLAAEAPAIAIFDGPRTFNETYEF